VVTLKAVVLAGGYATRLRPISYALPKLLFPVLGKPMIYWTLDLLRNSGVDEVILGVNYLADLLRAVVGDKYENMAVKYSHEDSPLGTAGPIKLASGMVPMSETFVAMNGDIITNIDLTQMKHQHETTHAAITDALYEVKDPRRFGVVQLNPDGHIARFVEKPKLKDAPSRLINAGIYMIQPEVLEMIPPNKKVSLEREIFPVLATQGSLCGFPLFGYWFDIGDMAEFRKANFQLLKQSSSGSILQESGAQVAADAKIKAPSFLGEDSQVESKASAGPYVLVGKKSRILKGAKVSNSILFDNVTVGEGSVIQDAIIASNTTIGKKVRIEAGAVISPHVQIHDGIRVGRNAIVHPFKEIAANIRAKTHAM
jgi:NDP-sugar pyrophosphorylase family protein